MARPLRFIPENSAGVLVEVSCRTIEALPLLRPSRRLNEIAAGVIGRALEIGPGDGALIVGLAGIYQAVTGIDSSAEMLAHTAQATRKEKNISLIHADFLEFSNEENYELIVAAMAVHHLPSPAGFFHRARRLLKPGGSLIVAELGGRKQLVGHDENSLGGWDPQSGRRLWTLQPRIEGDFNVPAPVVVGQRLMIATENNGARLYGFDKLGRIIPQPVAENGFLAPDMSTAVHAAGRLFCVWNGLFCLDSRNLKDVWTGKHKDLQDYGAVFASNTRVLAVGRGGSLLLVDAQSPQMKIISQLDVLPDDDAENYSHPALVGTRLYLRGENQLVCVELAP